MDIWEIMDERARQNENLIINKEGFDKNIQHYVTGKLAQIIHDCVGWRGKEESRQDSDWLTSEEYIQKERGMKRTIYHYKRLLLGFAGVEDIIKLNKADKDSFFKLADRPLGRIVFEDLWRGFQSCEILMSKNNYGPILFY